MIHQPPPTPDQPEKSLTQQAMDAFLARPADRQYVLKYIAKEITTFGVYWMNADDVFQEVYIRAITKDAFREASDFKTYLCSIATNYIKDSKRAQMDERGNTRWVPNALNWRGGGTTRGVIFAQKPTDPVDETILKVHTNKNKTYPLILCCSDEVQCNSIICTIKLICARCCLI